ncbi:MAG: Methionine--tRNA ligase [Parcubacteria bacterium OLB19]|nr:MAG: Methionine--tRNA ligase [Parcubacteria bacterium OLB19]
MERISYDDFAKVEIKIGTIKSVEVVPEADRLLKLMVDFGEEELRQIVSGIRTHFTDIESLVGLQCPFITNLEPRKIKGLISDGMILAVSTEDSFSLLVPQVPITSGAKAK